MRYNVPSTEAKKIPQKALTPAQTPPKKPNPQPQQRNPLIPNHLSEG